MIIIKSNCIFILAISCILFINYSSAAIIIKRVDSSILTKEYQQSKQYFLDKYGKDDSSRALIEFFFKRRHSGKLQTFIWTGVGAASGIFFDTVVENGSGPFIGGYGFFIGLLIACLIWTAIGGVLAGIFVWIKYSRRRLLVLLNKYNNGKGMPKNIITKQKYIKELQLQQRK